MTAAIDTADLRRWIGAEESVTEMLSEGVVARFHATFGLAGEPAGAGAAAPRHSKLRRLRPETPAGRRTEDLHWRPLHRDGALRHGFAETDRSIRRHVDVSGK